MVCMVSRARIQIPAAVVCAALIAALAGCDGDGQASTESDATDATESQDVVDSDSNGFDARDVRGDAVANPDHIGAEVSVPDAAGDVPRPDDMNEITAPDAFDDGTPIDGGFDESAPDANAADTTDPDVDCGDGGCDTSCVDCVGGECVAGECINHGCLYPFEGRCTDTYTITVPSVAFDWETQQSMCEEKDGTWTVCPKDGRLLDVLVHVNGSETRIDHWYLGPYCSAAEAAAKLSPNYAKAWGPYFEVVGKDDSLVCQGDPVCETIGCVYEFVGAEACHELEGGIHQENAEFFSRVCTEYSGGQVVPACDRREVGVCESLAGGEPVQIGPHSRSKYYTTDDAEFGRSQCDLHDDNWLITECTTQEVAYGECTLVTEGCMYPAGIYQTQHYDMKVIDKAVEPVGSMYGYSCCHDQAADALDAAIAALAVAEDLSKCGVVSKADVP